MPRRNGHITLVGPMPPPIDGRAQATAWLVEAVKARAAPIRVVNTQAAGRWRMARKAWRCCRVAASVGVRPPSALVIVVSGSYGMLLEALPAVAARSRGTRTIFVHHSSHYATKKTIEFRILLAAAGRRTNFQVCLCSGMRNALVTTYGLDRKTCRVVSNAGHMADSQPLRVVRESRCIHLSNLSVEKGLLDVLEIAAGIPGVGLAPIVTVAGPTSTTLSETLRKAANVSYVGPVYGDDKRDQLSRARVLLFPSRYRHEAQPIVIFEAAAVGTIPVAWDIGWIREQMADLGLERFVFPVGDVEALARCAEEILLMDEGDFEKTSEAVRSGYDAAVAKGRQCLDDLLNEVTN